MKLRANSEEIKIRLRKLAHDLEEVHKDVLNNIVPAVLVVIHIPETGEKMSFIVGEGSIKESSPTDNVKDKIFINYRDFFHVLEKPQRIVNYLLKGRVKIEGDFKRVVNTLSSFL
ncbi:hypothetical protein [Thermocrinis sp.]|uniref:hypothetical protein n=1 Tax=Thermocrinis sp. TaxID=2024383 RepID=UPI002FDD24A9